MMDRARAVRTLASGLLSLAACACASHGFQLPTGSGAPALDAATAWIEATETCRGARTLSAELRLSGRAGSLRARGTLHGAVTSADQIYLEMPASFGAPYFVLAGTGDRATLVRRDKGVLTARADEILEALIGLRLGPRQLLGVLAGCGDQASSFSRAARFADVIAVTTPNARVFLQKRAAAWAVTAAEISPLLFDYRVMDGAWPARIGITSEAASPLLIKMSVALSQVETNTQIAASIFTAHPPADAIPLTLEQLRMSGPLGNGK